MYGTIVVPLDGSLLAERSIPYAAALARHSRARLILVHVHPAGESADPQTVAALNAAADELRGQRLDAEVCLCPVLDGDSGAEIVRFAGSRLALTVMSTQGWSGPGQWACGSVAEEAVRRSETPVLLVPVCCTHELPEHRPLRVLVPLDGAAPAEAILGPVAELAELNERLPARLLLLRVVDPLATLDEPDQDAYPRIEAGRGGETYGEVRGELGAQAAAERYLRHVARGLPIERANVETLVRRGQPAPMIAAEADGWGADLIAMATQGRGVLAHLVLGSVTFGVLRRTRVPLLLVRPAAVRDTIERGRVAPGSRRVLASLPQ